MFWHKQAHGVGKVYGVCHAGCRVVGCTLRCLMVNGVSGGQTDVLPRIHIPT